MTYNPLVPGKAPDTEVMRGNPWTQPITLPTTDTADNPIDWSGSTFTVTSTQTDLIELTVVSVTELLLSLDTAATAGIAGRYVHWYVADDVVMNDMFLTGRIALKDKQ